MPDYCVNATLTMAAYIYITADTPEQAMEEARDVRPQDFDVDTGSAEVEFNVIPEVTLS